MEKKTSFKWLIFFVLIFCLINSKINVNAQEQVASGYIDLDAGSIEWLEFSTYHRGIIVIDFRVVRQQDGSFSGDTFDLILQTYKGYDSIDIEKDRVELSYGETCEYGQYYCAQELQNGNYRYEFNSNATHDLLIDYTVSVYPCLANSFSVSTNEVQMVVGKEQDVKITPIPSDSYLPLRMESSNSKSVEGSYDDDEVRIYGNRIGTYFFKIRALNGYSQQIKVTVVNPERPVLDTKSLTLYVGESIDNILHTNQKIKWSSSNKKIVTVNSKGVIKAKNVGKATVTGKVGKKKYVCKITVRRQMPNFYAELYDYDTRNNYFSVCFYNNSNKPITITAGTKVMHVAYRSYDRNLKLKKKVTIKPYKSLSVRFYVKGRVTWYDYERYTLQYKFTYDKKTYTGRVWDEDSVFKNGSKWYNTYNDAEDYSYWLGI